MSHFFTHSALTLKNDVGTAKAKNYHGATKSLTTKIAKNNIQLAG